MIDVALQFERDGFALDVRAESDARILGVFGPSGAGKSTLVELLAGLARPASGHIRIGGTVLFDAARSVNIAPHERRVGVAFQEHRLFPHMSVERNLRYGMQRTGSRFDEVVSLLELQALLTRSPGRLSGGERQRVAIGRAILSDPQLLILDEPLASLDRRLRRQILPYIRRIPDVLPVPIVYISHALDETLQLTDELLLLHEGKVAGMGAYQSIVHEEDALNVLHTRGMVNLVRGTIARQLNDTGMTEIDAGGATLVIPGTRGDVGDAIACTVQPWDIALAVRRVDDTSIRNQIPGRVTRVSHHAQRALVEVDIGVSLVVEISRRSAESLSIGTGTELVCLIKSNACRRVS